MLNILAGTTCSGALGFSIPEIIPALVHLAVLAIKIFIPIILIVLGMMDLAKAVMANEEKAMKEAQSRFIKRLLYAVLVFLVVAIVQTIFGLLAGADATEGSTATACINCFINNEGC